MTKVPTMYVLYVFQYLLYVFCYIVAYINTGDKNLWMFVLSNVTLKSIQSTDYTREICVP